jgi:zeaxanthin glucosyltransferase
VLATGRSSEWCPGFSTPPNAIVVKWAPQIEVLKRATMMITHGGLGAVKECIVCAVPMLVVPFRWDQPHNAARVVFHGLGARCESSAISFGRLSQLIDAVIADREIRKRVEEMSRRFNEVEGSGIGVRTVWQLLHEYRDGKRILPLT